MHLASHKRRPIVIKCVNSGAHITVDIKVVCLSVNLNKLFLIFVSGGIVPLTVPESCAVFCFLPYTISLSCFIKLIGYAAACVVILTRNSRIIFAEIMPCSVNFYPTGLKNSADRIVICAVHFEKTRACIVYIAALFADKLSVDQFIFMSRCGYGRAPVNNGVADFAERSSRVARFRAGRRLVSKRFGGMDMSSVPRVIICLSFGCGNHIFCHLIHLGVNLRTFTGESICRTINKCYKTAVDLHADVDGPEFLHALELSIGICRLT